METVSDFIFWGSKITADGDCSHEIKRRLLLGRKVMTNLDSMLKSRDMTLPTKEQMSFNFMAAVTIYSDFGGPPPKTVHCLPVYHEVMGLDAMILVF